MEPRDGAPREYTIESLAIFDELADWIYIRDLNPESVKNYWGNKAIRHTFNDISLEDYIAQDLRAITSPAMLQWSKEMYEQVQVQGQRPVKRRTIYPTGKPVHVMDLAYAPIHLRVPAGENGELEVKILALVHGKRVNLNDEATQEANRAAVLMNFVKDAIFLLPGRPVSPSFSHARFLDLTLSRGHAEVGGSQQKQTDTRAH